MGSNGTFGPGESCPCGKLSAPAFRRACERWGCARNPNDVRPEDLDAALIAAGFSSHQEGSHKTYRRDGEKLTVPQRTPFLKSVYVLTALDLLAVGATAGDDEETGEGEGEEGED